MFKLITITNALASELKRRSLFGIDWHKARIPEGLPSAPYKVFFKRSTVDRLDALKLSPDDTYEDVIRRLL